MSYYLFQSADNIRKHITIICIIQREEAETEALLGDFGPNGSSKEMIDAFTIMFVFKPCHKNKDNPNCVVCFSNFKVGEQVRRLPCAHLFHRMCIDRWLRNSQCCPLCRHSISENKVNLNVTLTLSNFQEMTDFFIAAQNNGNNSN